MSAAPPAEKMNAQKPADSAQAEETAAAEDPPEKNALAGVTPVPVSTGAFLGKDAKEKREIFERLTAYKKSHGLGCCRRIAEASNGALTEEDVRTMLDAGKRPISAWKIVGAALDYLEKKENQNG